jgi:hypothetical protein
LSRDFFGKKINLCGEPRNQCGTNSGHQIKIDKYRQSHIFFFNIILEENHTVKIFQQRCNKREDLPNFKAKTYLVAHGDVND